MFCFLFSFVFFFFCLTTLQAFPDGSVVKNPPANTRAIVQSLGQKDPLEKEMRAHSSILAWETPWTEEPGGLQSMGLQSWTPLRD